MNVPVIVVAHDTDVLVMLLHFNVYVKGYDRKTAADTNQATTLSTRKDLTDTRLGWML